jgi:hypothetical protein
MLALALLASGCGKDSTPSAADLRAEAKVQASIAADKAKEDAQKAADKAKETAQDVANGPDTANAPSLKIESPAEFATVAGGAADIKVLVNGVTIVKADGDTSGKTGHFHVFIDRNPSKVGEVIPKDPDVVHSADNPIHVTGLTPGKHTLIVVLGDGAHHRILENVQATVNVNATA